MDNVRMIAELTKLPAADMLTATKIDDPIGAGEYYRADTVVLILAKERDTCNTLRTALSDLLQQIECRDGTDQLNIEQAKAALNTPNA